MFLCGVWEKNSVRSTITSLYGSKPSLKGNTGKFDATVFKNYAQKQFQSLSDVFSIDILRLIMKKQQIKKFATCSDGGDDMTH